MLIGLAKHSIRKRFLRWQQSRNAQLNQASADSNGVETLNCDETDENGNQSESKPVIGEQKKPITLQDKIANQITKVQGGGMLLDESDDYAGAAPGDILADSAFKQRKPTMLEWAYLNWKMHYDVMTLYSWCWISTSYVPRLYFAQTFSCNLSTNLWSVGSAVISIANQVFALIH